jgi:bacterioferritin
MQINSQINQNLNRVLTHVLTGINQYFLHARMYQHWGFESLNKKNYAYSIQLMKSSDKLIQRILFLEGLPNLQKLTSLHIGSNVEESFKGNDFFERALHESLTQSIALCESLNDFMSRELLQVLIESSENQIDWIETQALLLQQLGLQDYLQSQMLKD